MGLYEVLRAVKRHWLLVLAGATLAIGLACVVTALTPPRYTTSLTFFVTTQSDSYQGNLFSQQRVKSYASLLTSDRLTRAIADSGVGLTAAEVRDRIDAEAVPETALLKATVTDTKPARAKRVAAELAKRFTSYIEALETPLGDEGPAIKIELVVGPSASADRVSPMPWRNLAVGALLGLLAGTAGAVLRDRLDLAVRTPESLHALTGKPTLAVIPFDRTVKTSWPLLDDQAGAVAESFRQLRTALQFVNPDRAPRTVVVTSSLPEEGKSTTAVGLAMACAEAGQRVLLIDGDLRRPRLVQILGLERAAGLSDVLMGGVPTDRAVRHYGPHQLYVLQNGSLPPYPGQQLATRRMRALLAEEATRFDVVIVDTPPVLPVTDAAAVGSWADGVVLVVRSGKTPGAAIRSAIGRLDTVGARTLGCVLAMQPRKSVPGYNYGYDQVTPSVSRRPPAQAHDPGRLPYDGVSQDKPAL